MLTKKHHNGNNKYNADHYFTYDNDNDNGITDYDTMNIDDNVNDTSEISTMTITIKLLR